MPVRSPPVPYCGAPPSPAELLARWNFDPVLIAALAVIALVYALGARKAGLGRVPRALFACGWALTAAALVSPLCPLSVSLFAARVGQHMVLTLLAAPLVAAGRPVQALTALLRRGTLASSGGSPMAAALVFAALLWGWHAPAPYAATFQSPVVYWTMHLSLYGSALWLWSRLLVRPNPRPAVAIAAGLLSTVQMGLLGALITLSPQALYAPHALTTAAWGLTPLQDQQLGGAIMWIPGCLAFLAAAMAELWALISEPAPASRKLGAVAR